MGICTPIWTKSMFVFDWKKSFDVLAPSWQRQRRIHLENKTKTSLEIKDSNSICILFFENTPKSKIKTSKQEGKLFWKQWLKPAYLFHRLQIRAAKLNSSLLSYPYGRVLPNTTVLGVVHGRGRIVNAVLLIVKSL